MSEIGRCIILNYSSKSKDQLALTIQKEGYECFLYDQLTRKDTEKFINKESKIINDQSNDIKYKCFILAIFINNFKRVNGSFNCKDGKTIFISDFIHKFYDQSKKGDLSDSNRRIPTFFFVNCQADNDQQPIKPYYHIIKKCHFFICFNEYSNNWLIEALSLLYKSCQTSSNCFSIGFLEQTICSQMSTKNYLNTTLSKFSENNTKDVDMHSSDISSIDFRKLILKFSFNSFEDRSENFQPLNSEIDIIYNQHNCTGSLGRCLIINYLDTVGNYFPQSRFIANRDANMLEMTMESLGFDVDTFNCLKVERTIQSLFFESKLNQSCGMFVLFILARFESPFLHELNLEMEAIRLNKLNEEYLLCRYDKPLFVPYIFDMLRNEKCATLAGKPKLIFLIHYERLELDGSESSDYGYVLHDTINLNEPCFNLPEDFLVFMTTRFATEPIGQFSIVIQQLRQLLLQYSHRYDILTILHQLNYGLHLNSSQYYCDNYRNWYLKSTLTKLVFFRSLENLEFCNPDIEDNEKLLTKENNYLRWFILVNYNIQQQEDTDYKSLTEPYHDLNFDIDIVDNQLDWIEVETCIDKVSQIVTNGNGLNEIGIPRSAIVLYINIGKENLESNWFDESPLNAYELLTFFVQDVYTKPVYNRVPCFIHIEDLNLNPFSFQQFVVSNLFIEFNSNFMSTELVDQINQEKYLEMENLIFAHEDEDDTYDQQFSKAILGLSVKEPKFLKTLSSYPIQNNGICLIICYDYDNTNQSSTENYNRDSKILNFVFESMGFSVASHSNLTKNETIEVIISHVTENFSDDESTFVLVVLAKHKNDYFQCKDDHIIFRELIDIVDNHPKLKEKPKICIFEDPTTKILSDDFEMISPFNFENLVQLPSNFLWIQSAHYIEPYDLYMGNKSSTMGSWFLQSLAACLQEYYFKYDLCSIIRIVLNQCSKPNFFKTHWYEHGNFPLLKVQSTMKHLLQYKEFSGSTQQQ